MQSGRVSIDQRWTRELPGDPITTLNLNKRLGHIQQFSFLSHFSNTHQKKCREYTQFGVKDVEIAVCAVLNVLNLFLSLPNTVWQTVIQLLCTNLSMFHIKGCYNLYMGIIKYSWLESEKCFATQISISSSFKNSNSTWKLFL